MATIYLIDASPYIFRAYFALPPTIKSPDGRQVNAVYGYCDFLLQIIQKTKPAYLAVAFDGSLTTSFRNEIYPDYKAQRDLPPAELEAQLSDCRRVTGALGILSFIDDRYESDDIIGTLTARFSGEHDIVIVSSDKDFSQFVDDGVQLWDYARDVRYDPEKVAEKFGVKPSQIIDLLALQGDSVDNIPGVKGIGPKTAAQLLTHYGSLQALYEKVDTVADLPIRGAASVKSKLLAHRGAAEMSYQLARIATDAPADTEFEGLAYGGARRSETKKLFDELGFASILNRIPRWSDEG